MSSSSSEDVHQHERKSKRKQDQVVLKSESEDETSSEESESESESVSNENSSNKQLLEGKTMGEPGTKTKHNESKAVSSSSSSSSSSEDESSSAEQTTMNDHHTKKTISVQKGLASEDVTETAKKNSIQPNQDVRVANKLFKKKFSLEDEEKILQVLVKEGDTVGTQALWRRVKDSMQLSISVTESQLYDKARRLKSCYLKRLTSNNFSMNDQEYKVYELSDKIWGKDEKAKLKAESEDNEHQKPTLLEQPHAKKVKMHNVKRVEKDNEKKQAQENKEKKRALGIKKGKNIIELDTEYKHKHDIFMKEVAKMKDNNDFPLDLAMELVRASKKLDLEKRWKHLRDLSVEMYMTRTRLIHETLEEVPSPSHSN
ncbi:hypothetical protein L6452_18929 [Arctium lappa]|uniref:Uncharacterized protein n=1 Tax=Arctium lappa TaxID=4217 RepID=A0ACB9B8E5_ARCLA|nr:hypothetical protein L6452_18929 [Arctium lappa]